MKNDYDSWLSAHIHSHIEDVGITVCDDCDLELGEGAPACGSCQASEFRDEHHPMLEELEGLRTRADEVDEGATMAFRGGVALAGELIECERREAALLEELERLRGQYSDLIMRVVTKYDGETRHETAKRYIHEAENRRSEAALDQQGNPDD